MDLLTVAERNVPVLCIDTCSILDIIRNPTRDKLRPHDFRAALDLIDAAGSGDLAILVAEQVEIEFLANKRQVKDEADVEIEKLVRRVTGASGIAAVFGSSAQVDLSHLDGHSSRAALQVERLMASAITVVPGADVSGKAFLRVNAAIAPARKGKDSSKDCLIFETYLEAMQSLRTYGSTAPAVLVSSNTEDYAGKAAIENELAVVCMSYQSSMGAARNALL